MISQIILIPLLAAAVLVFATNWLALIPWRRAKGKHWTERARLLFPARGSAANNLWCMPVVLVLALGALSPDTRNYWAIQGFAAWIGVLIGSAGFDLEVFPEMTLREWCKQAACGAVLRFSKWVLFVLVIAAMPADFGWQTWGLLVLAVAFLLWFAINGGFALMRRMRLLTPAPDSFSQKVIRLGSERGVVIQGVWLIQIMQVNAYALVWTQELIFSKPMVDVCPPDEIEAICVHEITHLAEPKREKIARLAAVLTFVPWLLVKPLVEQLGVPGLAIPFVVMLLIVRFVQWHSQRLEKRADLSASESETVKGTYARALLRLYEKNQMPAVIEGKGKSQSHPDLFDRLLAVGITPDFPKPVPAQRLSWNGMLLSGALGILIVIRFSNH